MQMPASAQNGKDSAGAFAEHVHRYLGEFLRSADQKAGFVLAAGTALAGFTLQAVVSGKPAFFAPCAKITALAGVLFSAISAVIAIYAVRPQQDRYRFGLIAFNGICELDRENYRAKVMEIDSDSRVDELAYHSHELARVLKDKYRALRWAVWAFGLGGAFILFAFGYSILNVH